MFQLSRMMYTLVDVGFLRYFTNYMYRRCVTDFTYIFESISIYVRMLYF